MDIGTGIGIAGGFACIASVTITCIIEHYKFKKGDPPGTGPDQYSVHPGAAGNDNGHPVTKELCKEKHKAIDDKQKSFEDWLRDISKDVKTLLIQSGCVPEKDIDHA